MTREEAKLYAFSEEARRYEHSGHYENSDDNIDKIYDDFESRTCENCKCWEKDNSNYGHKIGYCDKDIGNSFTIDNATKHDFGCNKWEQK